LSLPPPIPLPHRAFLSTPSFSKERGRDIKKRGFVPLGHSFFYFSIYLIKQTIKLVAKLQSNGGIDEKGTF